MQSLYYSICTLAVVNSDRCCEFIYTCRYFCKVSSKQIFTNNILSVFYCECKSLEIFFCYFTLDCLRDVDVAGSVIVIVSISNSCRIF